MERALDQRDLVHARRLSGDSFVDSCARRITIMSSLRVAVAVLCTVVLCSLLETSAVQQKRQVYRGFHQGLAVPVGVPVALGGQHLQQQHHVKKLTEEEKEAFRAAKREYLGKNKIPGRAGIDYPTFHEVPQTSFSCHDVPVAPGMYANVETGCQAYHVCHDGREGDQGASFLCPNGTLFNQHEFNCDWWYNVDCRQARSLYSVNLDPEKNPYFPKKKPEEELAVQQLGVQQDYQQYQQYQQNPQYQQYQQGFF